MKYRGRNIAEVLTMTVDQGVELFENVPNIHRILRTLQDVGLGYIRLGQSATFWVKLSGQIISRTRERSRVLPCLLDEPTTGLHLTIFINY